MRTDPSEELARLKATRPVLPESSPTRAEYVDLLGYTDDLEAALERHERLSWKRAAATVAMTEKALAATKRAEAAEAALAAAIEREGKLRRELHVVKNEAVRLRGELEEIASGSVAIPANTPGFATAQGADFTVFSVNEAARYVARRALGSTEEGGSDA